MISFTSGDARNRGLDGLRGLAVAAVLAFHAGQTWAPGGFLGVDSFFVLSGFLITALLLRERSRTGRISLREFWARRMARLIPALALMVTVVMVIAAVHHPDTVTSLRADAGAAMGYFANWRFLVDQSDYFGQTATTSLFEHTWSLSIEEQFYLLWPLIVVVLARTRRPRFAVGLVAALGASASVTVTALLAASGADTPRLYFGTDTRIQAILIGATLGALLTGPERAPEDDGAPSTRRAIRNGALHVLAITGIVGTALLWSRLDGGSPTLFRGGLTVAALATAAIIPSLVLVPNGPLGQILGFAPLRALGVISYGVYLWHWPIQLLLTGEATGWQGTPLLMLRAVVTVLAATLSYVLLEQPLRGIRARPTVRLVSFGSMAASAAAVAFLVPALMLPPTDTLVAAASIADVDVYTGAQTSLVASTTMPPAAPSPPPSTRAPAPTTPRPTTTTIPPPTPNYRTAVLGDSVAQSIARGMAPVSARYGLTMLDQAMLGCGIAPTGSYRIRGEEKQLAGECITWESTWAARVQAAAANVVVVQLGRHEVLDRQVNGAWQSILDAPLADAVAYGLDRAIEIAGFTGAPVLLLTAPYFQTGEAPDGSPRPENDPARVNRFNQLLLEAAGRHPGTVVIDLGGLTNPGGHYASSVGGVRMRIDGVHYTRAACTWFAAGLATHIRTAAGG